MTPDGTTLAAQPVNSGPFQAIFTVKNTGNQLDTYTLGCVGTNGITCSPLSPATLRLTAGASSTVKVFYSTGATTGTGSVQLSASGEGFDRGYYNQPIVSNSPLVSLAPHSPGARDLTDCVAACFNKIWTHSTPEVFIKGRVYAFTLVYQSGRAVPTSFIPLDVSPGGIGGVPTHYEVQVRRASNNTLMTLLNGATSVFYAAAGATQRLVVGFDRRQNNLSSADVAFTVTVTAYFASGSPGSTTLATNAIGVDRSQGAFGAGFWPASLQQYFTTSAGRLVAEAEGAAFLFTNGAIPGGTNTAITVNGTTWVRRTYLDGSYVELDYNTGLPNKTVDRFGTETTYFWGGTRLDSIGIPQNRKFRLGYDANGRLATVTDPGGRITSYTVDAQNRLTRIEDPDGRATSLSYDSNGLLLGVTTRNGAEWRTGYDAARQIAADSAPAIETHTGALKRPVVQYFSDLTTAWQPATAGISQASAKAAVQSDTLVARVTAPRGAVTTYVRDRLGLATKVVNHYGATTTIVRDTMGRPTSVTEPNGHQTTNIFTGYLLTRTTDVTTARVINYTYNARNDVTTVTGDVVRSDFLYWPNGALKQTYLGNTSSYPTISATAISQGVQEVGSDGRLGRFIDNANHDTEYYYVNSTANLSHTIDPQGHFLRWRYDDFGRLDSTSSPGGDWTIYTYGSLNQKLTETNPFTQTVTYEYDPQSLDVVRITDAKGQIYKFSYNALGMLTARHDLADTTKADSLWYDEEGNVRKVRTRKGDVITMEYDLIGRLLTRTGPNMPVDSFRFANNGRWMVAANSSAYDSLAFDNAGRLVFQRQGVGNVWAIWRTTYDKQDRVVSRELSSYAPVAYQSYSFFKYHSQVGVLDTVCTSATTCSAIALNGELLPVSTTYYQTGGGGSPWTASQTFDPTHGIESSTYSPPSLNSQFGVGVGRDSLNGVKYRIRNSGTNPIRSFGYDKLHRLINSCDSTSGLAGCINEYGASTTPAYAYDPAGNRIDPLAQGPLSVGAGNRVFQFKGFTYSYDASGNITSRYFTMGGVPGPSINYNWDAMSRLTSVDWGGNRDTLASFAYDAFGRRVSKTTPTGTQRYIYDGDRVVMDVGQTGAVTNEYFYHPVSGRLLTIRNASWLNSFHHATVITDPDIGSVRGVAQFTGGARIKQYPEEPWGKTSGDTGIVVRMRMAGQEYDAETELYLMGTRYYDPVLGRFMSEDPIGVQAGLNLYSYAGNDPVNLRDPTGLDPCRRGEKKDGCSLPTIEVTTPFMPPIPRLPPPPHLPLPRSPVPGPAGPGGFGGGGGGSPPQLAPADPGRCAMAIGALTANLVLDFSTAYLLASGGALVFVGGRAILRGVLAEGASVFYNGGVVGLRAGAVVASRSAGRRLAASGGASVMSGLVDAGTGFGKTATGVAADAAQGLVPSSPWGLLPGNGSYNAGKEAIAECKQLL